MSGIDKTLFKLTDLKPKLDAVVESSASFEEKSRQINDLIDAAYFSPKIAKYLENKLGKTGKRDVLVTEALIRPTGLLDPIITLKPVKNQVDDVLDQVKKRVQRGQRVLITTLTKKFAEELDVYFKQLNIKSAYIHSEVETLDRLDILTDLRRGIYDVLIGINLLREGLDLPEVSLVAIFDADKEGFLRSKTSLVQIIGRAARHEEGEVIMYADNVTDSMRYAMEETARRREIQNEYNRIHGITPKTTKRKLETISDGVRKYNQIHGEPESKYKKDEEKFEIANKNSRGGRYRNKEGKQLEDRLKFNSGRQLYDNFNSEKEIEIQKILSDSKMNKDALMVELNLAIDSMNFERAAAIRDILKNL